MKAPTRSRGKDPEDIGGYLIERRLGVGGQAVVYLARTATGDPVAIKVLNRLWLADPQAQTRLVQEIAALKDVAAFAIARLLVAELDADPPYLVSEFVPGRSLADTVRHVGPLTGPDLERFVVGTAAALMAVHHTRLVHCDLKPGNLMLGPDGPRILDFGISAYRGQHDPTNPEFGILGTPAYLSPEQIKGLPPEPPSDIFAWASTMVYAARGKAPFTASDTPGLLRAILSEAPDLDGVPTTLVGPLGQCLVKESRDRPTAAELLPLLVEALNPDGPSVVLPPAPEPALPAVPTPDDTTVPSPAARPKITPAPSVPAPAPSPAPAPAPRAATGAPAAATGPRFSAPSHVLLPPIRPRPVVRGGPRSAPRSPGGQPHAPVPAQPWLWAAPRPPAPAAARPRHYPSRRWPLGIAWLLVLGVTLLVFPAVFLFSVLQDRSSTNGGVTSPKSGSGIITIPERNAEYFDHIAFGHGSSVVTVAKTGEVHQWALSGGGRQILPTIATSSALRAVALADGGSRVATLFREPDTTLVSVTETVGSPVENFFSPPGNISDLALCSSPRVTVTFDENHQVRIWNDKQGLPIGSPIATTGGSWFLDQASCTLAVVVPGPLIQVWDLPRGTLSFQVSPTQQVRDLTLSAAGLQVSALETGGEAGFPAKVETWTAADPAVPSNSIPVVNRPTLLTGNSQDTLFAISTGTTLELWDPVTGKLVMSLPEPPADARPLVELRFSPDDRTLVGRSASGQLVLWDLAQLMRTPSRSA